MSSRAKGAYLIIWLLVKNLFFKMKGYIGMTQNNKKSTWKCKTLATVDYGGSIVGCLREDHARDRQWYCLSYTTGGKYQLSKLSQPVRHSKETSQHWHSLLHGRELPGRDTSRSTLPYRHIKSLSVSVSSVATRVWAPLLSSAMFWMEWVLRWCMSSTPRPSERCRSWSWRGGGGPNSTTSKTSLPSTRPWARRCSQCQTTESPLCARERKENLLSSPVIVCYFFKTHEICWISTPHLMWVKGGTLGEVL